MAMEEKLSITKLVKSMLAAAKGKLQKYWKEVLPYAKTQFKNIAENIKMLGKLLSSGQITLKKAKLHLRIQKSTARTVFLSIEGLTKLAAEQAINAAIRSIRDVVNRVLGWKLL